MKKQEWKEVPSFLSKAHMVDDEAIQIVVVTQELNHDVLRIARFDANRLFSHTLFEWHTCSVLTSSRYTGSPTCEYFLPSELLITRSCYRMRHKRGNNGAGKTALESDMDGVKLNG